LDAVNLRWGAVLTLAAGILLGLLAFFVLPDFLLQFGFRLHPSVVVLAPALGLAAVLLGLDWWRRREQARLEQALAAQSSDLEQLRRQFIQRLDHELKNPLTAINVQLDNLGDALGGNPVGIADLRAQVDRLALLTRGLRRLADLETRPLEPERVDLEELLGEVVDLLQAPDRVELDVQQRPWAPPPVHGDRELLLLAFRNLVENALNYSSGMVEVRARQAGDRLQVEVIDTGRGIPEADLPHVREELFRASNVHDVAGSGLGLAMADRIISRHGGQLDLRSRPGLGTIATVELAHAPPLPVDLGDTRPSRPRE
jgi:two-component system OmpR family sensor kinase